jgi:glycosyltransferase involved in cell wall biosynthesis
MKISATIITFNEQENIRATCESVGWADEILVVDSQSTDATREIAQQCGARVINRQWPGFAEQKQFAAEQAAYDWIFSLDADERVSAELKAAIQNLRNNSGANLADAYSIARRAFYQGRWIRGGGWYPDRQLRLFKRSLGSWPPRHIHESVSMKDGARIENFDCDILNYTSHDAAHHHRKIGERYAPLAAQQMFDEGRRTSALRIGIAAPAAFLRSYLLKGGFRDGLAGFTIASFSAHHAFLKHLMLWEMQKK